MREGLSNNAYGIERMVRKDIARDAPFDLADFAATAHNTIIELLRWMDEELPERNAAMQARDTRFAEEQALQRKIDAHQARERRHAAAVKKAKALLAKEKVEAQALMEAANQRMKEAMTMAELVCKKEKQ